MFRPFAPAILEEKSKEYFELEYFLLCSRYQKAKKKKKYPQLYMSMELLDSNCK